MYSTFLFQCFHRLVEPPYKDIDTNIQAYRERVSHLGLQEITKTLFIPPLVSSYNYKQSVYDL